jgi:two-component system sensor histidine kinase PhoQ
MRIALDSLAARLLLASALLLPLFLGATGLYLDRSQRLGIEAAVAERLQLQILTLLAEAEFDQALSLPEQLLEARFNRPDSGLYALVSDGDGRLLWSSPSAVTLEPGTSPLGLPGLETGGRHFERHDGMFEHSYQVVWETDQGSAVPLLFTVREAVAQADAQLAIYRQRLVVWLGGSALLLFACQALILFWGLRPLRTLAGDITNIESGAADELGHAYPREIQTVTSSLNMLLACEKKRRERARNTLADLAHSLKTPLAVVRGADINDPDYPRLVEEQTGHMEQIVAYQLQRAIGGSHQLLQRVPVASVLHRLQATLSKVYADKGVAIELDTQADSVFRGDDRDFMELLGILMDNACKYGEQRVRVTASGGGSQPLVITVEDDGPGIPPELHQAVLERGTRVDRQQGGHGIGLAVAADLVDSYLGTLQVQKSELGGACLRVVFGLQPMRRLK